MSAKDNAEIIDFVRRTTEAITVISESTKGIQKVSEDLRDTINTNNTVYVSNFGKLDGKMDGLLTMFKYVIIPLVTGILALVGVKTIFKL